MIASQIRGAILLAVGDRWTKVAMVIAKVADTIGRDLPAGDKGYQMITGEIDALLRAGRLTARGNIRNWRFSEVRRSGRQGNSK
jgi:hypothetical protein